MALTKQMQVVAQRQKKLVVTNSSFQNLNYGKAVHALGSLRPSENKFSQSKGIICSINNFEGRIEFTNNSFAKNMVFIPSAILSNSQKYNKTVVDPKVLQFRTEGNRRLGQEPHAYL